MLKALNAVKISGKDVLPLVEGGKGISVTQGVSSGAWAAAGGVGTVSLVNPDYYDESGDVVPQVYHGKTRVERHEELVAYAIKGSITQIREAYERASGEGRIHVNALWEMGGAQRILNEVLDKTRGLVNGVTCGAGMPYKLGELTAKYGVHYYPIVSSSRAFSALWKRAYKKVSEWLGGVVYEDPWKAGGHNGLSNSEDPLVPEDPYPRVVALRQTMNAVGLQEVPIIMAGGVWYIRDFEHWLDNEEIGPICFQFGTRPLLTVESPISEAWKKRLMTLKEGDVRLHNHSPTGFYSSAIDTRFLRELDERVERQVVFSNEADELRSVPHSLGPRKKDVYLTAEDKKSVEGWIAQGFTENMKTPDDSLIFVTKDKQAQIRADQTGCMGCLSACKFSNWSDREGNSTGRKADPRSFCIEKTLMDISHNGELEDNLVFAGHGAYNFGLDPFYSNGFVPTVKELVDRIMAGD